MGQAIVKCARDRDLYLIWSSVVDAPVWVGNRAELAEYLRDEHGRAGWAESERSMDRADEYGSSDRAIGFGRWGDEELRLREGAPADRPGPDGYWFIRRDRLTAYAEALLAAGEDDETAGHDLMEWEEWE
jgi:hypothetical protein